VCVCVCVLILYPEKLLNHLLVLGIFFSFLGILHVDHNIACEKEQICFF